MPQQPEPEGKYFLTSDDFVGKPKGMKRILQERGLWKEGLKKQCGRAKKEELRTEEHYQARFKLECKNSYLNNKRGSRKRPIILRCRREEIRARLQAELIDG